MKGCSMTKDLLERYIKYFGNTPPFPPEHIMETLVEMKEDGTYGDFMETIYPKLDEIEKKIEKISGEKMSLNHTFFDINYKDK